jgi:hypothetical protein
MSDNFLYILGAGASCEAVPLVKDFPDWLAELANVLNNVVPNPPVAGQSWLPSSTHFLHRKPGSQAQFISIQGRDKFVEALRWLSREARDHASVDTLAKKFFLKGDQSNLKKLKAVLSSFFIVTQAWRPVDKRYDSFFASVLYRSTESGELQIPSNIRILTWNYDTQLEKAFHGFVEDNDEVYQKISVNHRIHRINGCCGKKPDGGRGDDFRCVWEAADASTLMQHSIKLFNDYQTSSLDADIRFAWERETDVYLSDILKAIQETTIAVIIGYSFPYFNRDIDKKIFNSMPKLQKVYLQYPEGVHATIEERVRTMNADLDHYEGVKSVTVDNQFYIPDEYSGPA